MQLIVTDGNGTSQTIVAKGIEAPIVRSGHIFTAGGVQTLLDTNAFRSGWFMQNTGQNVMTISPGFQVPPRGTFPPPNYPCSPEAITVSGTINDTYVVIEF